MVFQQLLSIKTHTKRVDGIKYLVLILISLKIDSNKPKPSLYMEMVNLAYIYIISKVVVSLYEVAFVLSIKLYILCKVSYLVKSLLII